MFKPSTVIACLALFVSLGSGAFAAATAIDGHSIKNRSIPANKLTRSAVRSLHGARGARGFQGPRGLQGPQGLPGAAGTPGAAGGFDPAKLQYITGPDVSCNVGETCPAVATCPPGTAAVSGGFFSTIGHIGFSETFGATFHGIDVNNDTSIPITIHATVVCSSK